MSANIVEEWVKIAVENEGLCDYTVEMDGSTNKFDGYLGNMCFVTLTGKTKGGQKKTLRLAIKSSKESTSLRETSPIKQAFEREIYVYESVFKAFDSLQKEAGNENFLDLLARSYGSRVTEGHEVLLLENLKVQGYDLWDRKKPMTYEHVKLVIQAYGKWHAFSFALRKKKKEVFEKLVDGYSNMFVDYFTKVGLADISVKLFEQGRDFCISPDETEILEKLQYSRQNCSKVFKDLFYEDPDERVILHGDCWNNNFMFKTDGDVTRPISVRVVDWQFSGYSSPAMDLSHYIYGSCDTGRHKNVKELLKVYYESFSKCLKYLGCNPDEVFPYDRLVYHWKKYSCYGLLFNGFLVKFSIIDVEEVPDLAEALEAGQSFSEIYDFDDFQNKDEYHRRVRNNLLHYVESLKC